jgi:hypothetical protein
MVVVVLVTYEAGMQTSELMVTVLVKIADWVSVDAAPVDDVPEGYLLTTAMRPLSRLAVPALDFR